jgi:ribosomal protein S18 acetylase RimI-like enzyme
MRPDEFSSFLDLAVASYAADNVAAGRWPAAEAESLARAETERLLAQGPATPDHYLYEIRDGTNPSTVGYLWFAAVPRGSTRVAFVFQVKVKPEFRRRGHARAALEAAERIARAEGFAGIALHVFARNEPARALYASLGYEVASVNMLKPFRQPPATRVASRDAGTQLSILTLPSLTTFAHLTSSVDMNWRNFSREPPPSSAP